MVWFEKVGGKTRVGRTIYLSTEEYHQLMREAEMLKAILKTKKISLSDVIRIKCFYVSDYFVLKEKDNG